MPDASAYKRIGEAQGADSLPLIVGISLGSGVHTSVLREGREMIRQGDSSENLAYRDREG